MQLPRLKSSLFIIIPFFSRKVNNFSGNKFIVIRANSFRRLGFEQFREFFGKIGDCFRIECMGRCGNVFMRESEKKAAIILTTVLQHPWQSKL